jgi:hypothetical protein
VAVPTAVAHDGGLYNHCDLLQRIFSQNEKNDTPKSAQENFLFIFLIHFEKYTIVSKFISFDHQPPWRTAAAMGHDVWKSNRRDP